MVVGANSFMESPGGSKPPGEEFAAEEPAAEEPVEDKNREEDEDNGVGKAAMRKLSVRILPLLCISSMTFNICRSHVWLAATSMMSSLSLDRAQFGFAISSYSIAYAIALVPASLVVSRTGPRLAFSVQLLAFATISMATAAVEDMRGLIGARVSLAIVQSGWIPLCSSYNSIFFKDGVASAMALSLSLGFTLSQIFPIASAILYASSGSSSPSDWQWLLLLEGIPPLVLCPIVFILLPSSPTETGRLLNEREQRFIERREEAAARQAEQGNVGARVTNPVRSLLADVRVILATLVAVTGFIAYTGPNYWSPTVIAEEGNFSLGTSAILYSIPNVVAIPVAIGYNALADRRGGSIYFAWFGQLVIALGNVGTALTLLIDGSRRTLRSVLLIMTLVLNQSGFQMWYNRYVGGSHLGAPWVTQ